MSIKRIGVLTGGGDAPGLNPAIRAVVLKAADLGIETVGIHDGWDGLLGSSPEVWRLDENVVRKWDRDGGTHLGSSRTNPFRHKVGPVAGEKTDAAAEKTQAVRVDRSAEVLG